VVLALLLAGCAATPSAPREYLDETTAATITVAADPWIFVRGPAASAESRDFLVVYGIDVNRSGDHRQYLGVVRWAPQTPAAQEAAESALLELAAPERTLSLRAAAEPARELGIAQPVAEPYRSARWWYFPIDKATLAGLARWQNLQAALVLDDRRLAY